MKMRIYRTENRRKTNESVEELSVRSASLKLEGKKLLETKNIAFSG